MKRSLTQFFIGATLLCLSLFLVQPVQAASNSWALMTPMPEGGSANGAAVVNGKIYVVGVRG
jgi:hypothetical protein